MRRLPDVIIAIDPGLATGFAVVRLGPNESTAPLEVVHSAELTPLETRDAFRTYAAWAFENHEHVEVVVEKFTITHETAKKSPAPWSLEVIGGLRWLLDDLRPGDELILQAPVDAKRLIPNDRLKAIGLWHRGGEGHARDALRHAGYRYVTQGWQGAGLE